VTADSAPPQLSPDGYWWWTGEKWVPAADLFAPAVAAEAEREPAQPEQTYAPAASYVAAGHVPVQKSWQPAAQEPQHHRQQPVIPAQTSPVSQFPVFEILPAGAAPPAKKPRRLLAAVAGAVASVLVIAGGAAYGITQYLGGGGQQPEDVLPANAVAVMKVDLDPSLTQKAALYRFSQAFPDLHVQQRTLKDDLLRPMFTGAGLDYDQDVKSWLGDRAAVAAVPKLTGPGFAPVAAVQYTDKDKAKRVLLGASMRAASGDNPFFFAFSGDYAVIAETQSDADRFAGAALHLADNASYAKAVASLDGDQLAVGWADVKGAFEGLKATQLATNPLWAKLKTQPMGSFVVGLRAASNYLEMQGKAVGISDDLSQQLGRTRTANLIGSLPSDTMAAMEATGLGEAMSRAFEVLPPPVTAGLEELGLSIPGDLAAILGTDAALGVSGDLSSPNVVAHVRTPNPARAVSALDKLSARLGDESPWGSAPFAIRREKNGYTLTTAAGSPTTGKLGSTPSFKRAVPDAGDAGMVVYVNLGLLPQGSFRGVENLDAIGMSVNGATGDFRLRLTTR
jgi:hypothetical protein